MEGLAEGNRAVNKDNFRCFQIRVSGNSTTRATNKNISTYLDLAEKFFPFVLIPFPLFSPNHKQRQALYSQYIKNVIRR